MSSYQMLRVVWTYLTTSDWTREGVSMAVEDEEDKVFSSGRDGLAEMSMLQSEAT